MQDSVELYTKALIRAIRDSAEYKAFCRIREQVDQCPELKKQISEFRCESYRMQNSGDENRLFEQVEAFRCKYETFCTNDLVAEYLRCELAVCRMLQKAANRIADGVDLDLEDVLPEINR